MRQTLTKGSIAAAALAVAVAAVTIAGSAAPATADQGAKHRRATGKNGICEVGELCLYYFQNYQGPVLDLYLSDYNFSDDHFPGTGTLADNNTESFWNRDTYTWRVYTGANGSGSVGCIRPGAFGNLSTTFRNTISSAIYSSTPC